MPLDRLGCERQIPASHVCDQFNSLGDTNVPLPVGSNKAQKLRDLQISVNVCSQPDPSRCAVREREHRTRISTPRSRSTTKLSPKFEIMQVDTSLDAYEPRQDLLLCKQIDRTCCTMLSELRAQFTSFRVFPCQPRGLWTISGREEGE